ncbi:MAG: hypothetical protein NTW86_09775 [Candidatus Sumerlaeota bacterium]|nr:hypothetical protein [Candidatus Sumerlaeota bacterium]
MTEAAAPIAPAYPLYAIARHTEPDANTTAEDLALVARSFRFIQGVFTKEQMDFMRSVNPAIKIVPYLNTEYITSSDEMTYIEQHRDQCDHYLAARLKSAIGPGDTQFLLEPALERIALAASAIPGELSSTDPDRPATRYCVTWIRIDGEFMRINAWNKKRSAITVARGLSGSKAAPHPAGANVFCPMYSANARPGGRGGKLNYHYDPAARVRWDLTLAKTLANARAGYDGSWLDLLSEDPFRATDSDGQPARPWNFAAGHPYTKDEYREANEKGIDFVQRGFQKQMGRWPLLLANNFQAPAYAPGAGGASLFLKPTAAKPRPLDGYCIESFAGSNEAETEYQKWLRGGPPVAPHKLSAQQWLQRVEEVGRAGEEGIAACPMNMNAGQKVEMYERCPEAARNEFELWAYASYLIGVVKRGANCSTVFGTPCFDQGADGARHARFNEIYTWDIGDPVETADWSRIEQYVPSGHASYVRRFAKGIVLVNPGTAADQGIALGGSYVDPNTNEAFTTIELAPHSARILLRQ